MKQEIIDLIEKLKKMGNNWYYDWVITDLEQIIKNNKK